MPGVSGLGAFCGSTSESDSSDESSEDEDEDDEDASLGSIGIFWALTLTGIVTVRWTSDADESESDPDDEEDEDDEATRLLRFRVRFLAAGSLEDGPAMGRGEVMKLSSNGRLISLQISNLPRKSFVPLPQNRCPCPLRPFFLTHPHLTRWIRLSEY